MKSEASKLLMILSLLPIDMMRHNMLLLLNTSIASSTYPQETKIEEPSLFTLVMEKPLFLLHPMVGPECPAPGPIVIYTIKVMSRA